eukprot:UN04722
MRTIMLPVRFRSTKFFGHSNAALHVLSECVGAFVHCCKVKILSKENSHFRMYFEIAQIDKCFKLCKFRSRKTMRMTDTMLESRFCDCCEKIKLGTTGVPHVAVVFHF